MKDLLKRQEIQCSVDLKALKGKRVLITGAGGSIGQAVVNLVSGYVDLTCLDVSEEKIFWMKRETQATFILGKVEDLTLAEIKKQDIIIHTAAYKHVGLCEEFPEQAVKTNAGLVTNLAGLCWIADTHFCFISTDKTVDARGVMGKTKWIAERAIDSWREMGLKTTMLRFANVLGSSGSVLQVWDLEKDIRVTDIEMRRWFILPGEAATGIVRSIQETTAENYLFAIKPDEETKIIDLAERYAKRVNKEIRITQAGVGEKQAEKFCYDNQYLDYVEGFLYVIKKEIQGQICIPQASCPGRNTIRNLS